MDKKYSPEEVDEILARAARLDAEEPDESALALQEVVNIGEEVGIDQAMIVRAASEMTRSEQKSNPLVGAPTKSSISRTFKSDEDLLTLVTQTNLIADTVGFSNVSGDMAVWRLSDPYRDLKIRFAKKGDLVSIEANEKHTNLLGSLFGGLMGGLGGGLGGGLAVIPGFLFGPVGVVVWLMLCIVLGYGTARFFYRRTVENRIRELEHLMDGIVQHQS